MGTRHLIAIQHNEEYVFAKSGQWDGYPEGVGIGVLNFLETANLEEVKENLKFLTKIPFDEAYQKAYGDAKAGDTEVLYKGISYSILSLALIKLHALQSLEHLPSISEQSLIPDNLDFCADSLFCEWAYIIDLDHETFEIYSGYNKVPLQSNERFFFLTSKAMECSGGDYHPVRLVKKYLLDSLPDPDHFIKEINRLT